jgi:hypothetical protein
VVCVCEGSQWITYPSRAELQVVRGHPGGAWRDAFPKQLRDEVKVQRPVGCSRYVAGFERCSPRGDCDIELAESARGASPA